MPVSGHHTGHLELMFYSPQIPIGRHFWEPVQLNEEKYAEISVLDKCNICAVLYYSTYSNVNQVQPFIHTLCTLSGLMGTKMHEVLLFLQRHCRSEKLAVHVIALMGINVYGVLVTDGYIYLCSSVYGIGLNHRLYYVQ